MYKMVEWNETLDLEEFYQEAERRGHRNNANQKSMIDPFYEIQKDIINFILLFNVNSRKLFIHHFFRIFR